MKFILHVIGDQDRAFADGEGPEPAQFIAWAEEATTAGVLLDGGFYDDYRDASSVVVDPASGERTVLRGPVPSAQEYLGGYSMIEVADLEAALEWAAKNPGAKWGRVEVRPVLG